MDKLRAILATKGASADALAKMNDDMIVGLSRAFGVDPTPYLPREVRLETGKVGATYVVTRGYPVPKYKDGKPTGEVSLARGLYARVDAIDDMIEDLITAKGLLEENNE